MRKALLVGIVLALAAAAPAAAGNVLPNGSFAGSLSGWKGWNATLASASDGVDGSGAARVTATATSYSINTSPRPVQGPTAGRLYTGTGWVRSDAPGRTTCLYLREWSSSGSHLASARQCVVATSSWQRFPTVSYTSQGGASIEEYVYSTGSSGSSFEVDALSLDDGAGASPPPDTTPPDTTIDSGPADGSSSDDTTASFSFSASESGSAFQCALDGAAWSPCTSPATYGGLAASAHTFAVRAIDGAGNADPSPATRSWTVTAPPPPPPPPAGSDPTMLLVGDQHACDGSGIGPVASLMASLDPDGVDPIASLGDASGDEGTASEYTNCFDPWWGQFKSRVRPAIGNHDWTTKNADGYFGYWGAAAGPVNEGWYSYDVGTWHVVVLSSYCGEVGGCGLGSPQVAWLKQDLAAHPAQCTLAYWHHPYFTSSPQPGTSGNTSGFWTTLYHYGADVVVNAHVREYERFAPQDPSGNADPANGMREFVVGTGGGDLIGYSSRATNSEAIEDTAWGVLELTLHPGTYDWRFVSTDGTYGDAGSGACH